jgi:hypothetical protein
MREPGLYSIIAENVRKPSAAGDGTGIPTKKNFQKEGSIG